MNNYIFKQLRFVRENTINCVTEINDEASLFIPEGFNNNIKWNIGHIYVVQEKFAYFFIKEKMIMPNNFLELFTTGTSPINWEKQELPTISELIQLLKNQIDRIEQVLEFRLKEVIEKPFTTSTGLTLSTVEELLSFCLYHEGMHFATIKSYQLII
ncbi:DinB family protein [Neobacillus cucumis]|uniref:DinB family protein n=1 Tax=Neobacillus cucumis TaxID=1740721 RepID=UPI0019669BE3|nr:DinB family protein [Neobacillus cucumis]MBM7651976.1 putative damage-inducible protein DinB [Neobacillus cucumis]